jgi:hypothetical protein
LLIDGVHWPRKAPALMPVISKSAKSHVTACFKFYDGPGQRMADAQYRRNCLVRKDRNLLFDSK